jgi:hypothetical protein
MVVEQKVEPHDHSPQIKIGLRPRFNYRHDLRQLPISTTTPLRRRRPATPIPIGPGRRPRSAEESATRAAYGPRKTTLSAQLAKISVSSLQGRAQTSAAITGQHRRAPCQAPCLPPKKASRVGCRPKGRGGIAATDAAQRRQLGRRGTGEGL